MFLLTQVLYREESSEFCEAGSGLHHYERFQTFSPTCLPATSQVHWIHSEISYITEGLNVMEKAGNTFK